MNKVTREYVRLDLFVEAARFLGVDIDVEYEGKLIVFYHSRYAMNPNGFHVGYEEMEGRLNIVPMIHSEFNSRQTHPAMGWLVDLASFDTTLTDAPEAEECSCREERKTKSLSPTLSVEVEEDEEDEEVECMCDLYCPPDDDFVWQECDHVLRQILDVNISWEFSHEDGWKMMRGAHVVCKEGEGLPSDRTWEKGSLVEKTSANHAWVR